MEVFKNVLCPFCGCCCDDLEVEVDSNKIINVKNACALGRGKFLSIGEHRLLKPLVKVDGELVETDLEKAVEKTVEMIKNSSYPVFYGFGCASCEAIKLCLEMADLSGGLADNISVVCHGPTILGLQDMGIPSATLGQIRHRADLIVYWGCNPVEAHPRHTIRYGPLSSGRFVTGRKSRRMVVIDVRKTPTATMADVFMQVKPNSDFEILTALRALVNDLDLEVEEVDGVPVAKLEELADMMINAKFGALFFGLGLTMSYGKEHNIEAAIALVRDLNKKTKFVMIPMRGHFNVTGANEVFTWQTGYPFCVDFSMGYPRYNPGETSAVDVIARGECDLLFIIGADPCSHLPHYIVERLKNVKLVVLDPSITPTVKMADVAIPVAYVGIEASGTAYRMDGVPLQLRKVVDPPPGILSDVDVLNRIVRRLK
ncbi:formylmethanofuran dehydrogenase subunit B [Candidatus Bathyarchaeota archaeon]|nr:formylmethanofuran dehydrogenase subunit B [Candidatus Bathyarchaeota archaeon]MBS7613329.1 formylmethanofuran dehydrogenase subunit B [Candidatus Bathyarchaeota archaeon]MBS7617013.1 formylmethanofuran dehydrogenase subunit B [Candidatus Bathyarchaeota archaeon]